MNVRLGLVLAVAALFSGAGCAAGGGGSGPSGPSGPALPGGEVLEEGITPRDNTHTRAADLYLTQAQSATEDAEAEEKWAQALQAAQEGIAADSMNPKSYFQAGIANVGLNNYQAADEMFDKAEELHPRYMLQTQPWREQAWVAAYNEAINPMQQGNLEEAAEYFEAATQVYDGRPEAHLQLGTVYSRLNRMDDAVQAYEEAMGILETTKEAQMADTAAAPVWEEHWQIATTGLGQALTFAERYEDAADHYGHLLEEDPDNITLMGSLAGALSELARVKIDSVETAVTDSVRAAELADSVAAPYADSAKALYDRILNQPGLTEADYFNAGVGLYQSENYDAAADAFRQAAEMNPFNRDAVLNLTQTLSISESFEELIPAARRLLEIDPRNALGWIYLTRALSETGQTEEANQVFQEYQSFGYEVEQLNLQPDPSGGATITGVVKNTGLEPGTPVSLRFHFGGPDGEEVGTVDIQVQVPEVEQSEVFRGFFESPEQVTGYTYEVLNP